MPDILTQQNSRRGSLTKIRASTATSENRRMGTPACSGSSPLALDWRRERLTFHPCSPPFPSPRDDDNKLPLIPLVINICPSFFFLPLLSPGLHRTAAHFILASTGSHYPGNRRGRRTRMHKVLLPFLPDHSEGLPFLSSEGWTGLGRPLCRV